MTEDGITSADYPEDMDTTGARRSERTIRPESTPLLDRVGAAALIAALSPALAGRAAVAAAREGHVFDHHDRLGAGGRRITVRSFAGDAYGRRLPYLFSIVRGDARFVGPQPLPADTAGVPEAQRWPTPGFMSPRRLRARTGIEYVESDTAPADDAGLSLPDQFFLASRYLVAEALTGTGGQSEHLDVLGVEITNTTMAETLDWIAARARTRPTSILAFVNSDCLNQAVEDPEYLGTLRRSERVVPDGIGVRLAARFQGYDIAENVNGTDMLPLLCERAVADGLSLYFLGARPGVAAAAADAMRGRHPGLTVAGVRDGYFSAEEEDSVVAEINASRADVLLVALGAPRQEAWLDRHRDDLDVGVAMGVGGLFDFYSGRIPRAPVWVREVGAEWVWRLAQEPGRLWRRYLVGNPLFLRRAYAEARRMRHARPPQARPPLLGYGTALGAPGTGSSDAPRRTA